MIKKWELQVNGVQVKEDKKLDLDLLIEERLLIVWMGKSKGRIIKVVAEKEIELVRQVKEADATKEEELERERDDSDDAEDEEDVEFHDH
jgi:hypothetical protein